MVFLAFAVSPADLAPAAVADRVGEPMAGLLHGQSGVSAADAADGDGIGHGVGHSKRVSSVAALLAEVAARVTARRAAVAGLLSAGEPPGLMTAAASVAV
ncbi:hypothetical protein [Streptomyces sp. L-9-10]|uniref:hypothetical protein n=1 Tax=Streptomyces sp. L-9-10 TaxID=1478131 RepID=UPI001F0147A2|nr:hypothetical protein [Streptomyces sp. L-9-10]